MGNGGSLMRILICDDKMTERLIEYSKDTNGK